jgi:hypothetical protein
MNLLAFYLDDLKTSKVYVEQTLRQLEDHESTVIPPFYTRHLRNGWRIQSDTEYSTVMALIAAILMMILRV